MNSNNDNTPRISKDSKEHTQSIIRTLQQNRKLSLVIRAFKDEFPFLTIEMKQPKEE